MKKLMTAIALSSLFATYAMAQDRVVTFTNNTGDHVESLFGSNAGASTWEEDLLGDVTLAPQEAIDVNFDDGTDYCNFDFKAVYADGSDAILQNVDVCEVSGVSIE